MAQAGGTGRRRRGERTGRQRRAERGGDGLNGAIRWPRVCLATDSLDPSGVGEHMLALGEALARRFAVVLACPPSPGGTALLRRATRLGLGIKRLDEDEADTRRWMERAGYDLLHVHAGIGWEGHHLAVAGRDAALGAIVRTEHLPDVITDAAQRRAHASGVALVDRVICVSHAAAATFLAAGLEDGKLAVVHNGLPERSPVVPRAAVRASLGCGESDRIVIVTARFTAQKDHATLIAAMPAVLWRQPGLRLWLAGSGPLEPAVRAQAKALGVAEAVTFLGQRDDVPDLLAAADLFVLPSRFEGLPLAAIEAMAAGLPVVATAVGGTDEVVISGETGLLVPPGEADALGAAMAAVIARIDRARAMGAAGRARYLQAFTATRMASDTARLYDELLAAAAQQERHGMTGGNAPRTRIGFIGAGGIAQRHLGVLESFEDVEITAFADPALDRASEAAARFGAHAYADAEAMLDAHPLDAVYICVPPFAHGVPERAAIARKLPFFVEKPIALDLALGEAIAREVDERGLVTGVGYHWRYLDTVDEVRGLLADNPAQLLSGYWLDSTPPPAWWWKQAQSGGQINEQTTHIVDLARYLAGPVAQVFGLAGHKPRGDFPGLDVATVSTASLRFASGAVGNIGSTCLLRWNHRVGLHIFADGMAVELTDHDLMVDVGRGRPVRGASGDPVWREDRDFIDAVRGGENRIRCSYAEALATLRITDAIRRSAESGKAVDLTPPSNESTHV